MMICCYQRVVSHACVWLVSDDCIMSVMVFKKSDLSHSDVTAAQQSLISVRRTPIAALLQPWRVSVFTDYDFADKISCTEAANPPMAIIIVFVNTPSIKWDEKSGEKCVLLVTMWWYYYWVCVSWAELQCRLYLMVAGRWSSPHTRDFSASIIIILVLLVILTRIVLDIISTTTTRSKPCSVSSKTEDSWLHWAARHRMKMKVAGQCGGRGVKWVRRRRIGWYIRTVSTVAAWLGLTRRAGPALPCHHCLPFRHCKIVARRRASLVRGSLKAENMF